MVVASKRLPLPPRIRLARFMVIVIAVLVGVFAAAALVPWGRSDLLSNVLPVAIGALLGLLLAIVYLAWGAVLGAGRKRQDKD